MQKLPNFTNTRRKVYFFIINKREKIWISLLTLIWRSLRWHVYDTVPPLYLSTTIGCTLLLMRRTRSWRSWRSRDPRTSVPYTTSGGISDHFWTTSQAGPTHEVYSYLGDLSRQIKTACASHYIPKPRLKLEQSSTPTETSLPWEHRVFICITVTTELLHLLHISPIFHNPVLHGIRQAERTSVFLYLSEHRSNGNWASATLSMNDVHPELLSWLNEQVTPYTLKRVGNPTIDISETWKYGVRNFKGQTFGVHKNKK